MSDDTIGYSLIPAGCRLDVRQAAYTWRGTGHFTGVLEPGAIPGTGNAFRFEGLEVFSFRGERVCALNAVYDLATLNRQTGVYQAARAARGRP